MSDGQVIAQIMALAAQSDQALTELTKYAKEQERAERNYNELQCVLKDIVGFLLATNQTTISDAWSAKRDVLIARALRLMESDEQQGSEVGHAADHE